MIRSHRVLALTARELEFTAHSYCSTEDGYRAQSCAQVSAVKLLEKDDVWKAKAVEDDEQEDAMMALSIIRRIVSRIGDQEKKTS